MAVGCERKSGGVDDSKVSTRATGKMKPPSTEIVKASSKAVGWSTGV